MDLPPCWCLPWATSRVISRDYPLSDQVALIVMAYRKEHFSPPTTWFLVNDRMHRVFYRCAFHWLMMTSSNGNIFRVTGPLCGEFTGPGEFHTQRPVTRSIDVFFDLRLYKRLSKQPWGWWFETLSWSLWRHCNVQRYKPSTNSCCRNVDKMYQSIAYILSYT